MTFLCISRSSCRLFPIAKLAVSFGGERRFVFFLGGGAVQGELTLNNKYERECILSIATGLFFSNIRGGHPLGGLGYEILHWVPGGLGLSPRKTSYYS